MKQKLSSWITLIACVLAPSFLYAAPRTYGKSGTATNVNTQVTVTFNPSALAVCNDSSSISLFVDASDGVAATTDNSTNWKIAPGECHTWTFEDKNVNNTFLVGLITASSTADYRLEAVR